eukprot:m.827916 g.827916  ORF g.827916 m.827916 type:complete len:70 (-) comp59432_c1_seq13:1370-1579(-)
MLSFVVSLQIFSTPALSAPERTVDTVAENSYNAFFEREFKAEISKTKAPATTFVAPAAILSESDSFSLS